MKKLKSKNLTLIAITSIGTSFAMTSPISVSATQNTGEKIYAMQTKYEFKKESINLAS
ncbi:MULTISPECIES: hypothetical protein [unclassified Lysinibacillus]|uniref:hypothetical protein n=1 Tax=unclassified Lysinibacillus TaxID=2636778 RepID=UPI0009D0CA58|nr:MULTISPECIES: hypothetical protein [unclassified Lysinibacillus]SKB37022.1 hypothetical protein SAMN06295926_10217 [Lysinibacillus sp. AC-3]